MCVQDPLDVRLDSLRLSLGPLDEQLPIFRREKRCDQFSGQ